MEIRVMIVILFLGLKDISAEDEMKCSVPAICTSSTAKYTTTSWIPVTSSNTNCEANSRPIAPTGEGGKQGEIGPIGPKGENGIKGDRGPIGPRGETASVNDTVVNVIINDTQALQRKMESLEMKFEQLNSTYSNTDVLHRRIRSLEDQVKELNGSYSDYRNNPKVRRLMKDNKEAICYMGMKSRDIPDSAITASHSYSGYTALRSRLDDPASWIGPEPHITGVWIQVDFGKSKLVAGVITQGRGSFGDFVKTYKISCGISAASLTDIEENGSVKIFKGNTADNNIKVTSKFPQPIICRYIRIYPLTWGLQDRYIAMRLEFIHGFCWDLY